MSPAVNLTLEEVPFAILDVVKARILANRRKRDDLRKPRLSLRPRPQFRQFGASSKSWRKPQHGAAVLGDDSRFGITSFEWTSNAYASGSYNPTAQWVCEIWCGDFSRSLKTNAVTFFQGDGPRPETLGFVLPVDNNTGIVVVVFYGEEELTHKKTRLRSAFIVNKDSIRQIQVPTIVDTCINQWESMGIYHQDFYYASIGIAEYFLALNFTPTIYERLNTYFNFTSNIKSFPANKRLVTRDPRQGIYTNSTTNITKSDPRFCFAEWLGTTEEWEINPFNGALLVRQPADDIEVSLKSAFFAESKLAASGFYWDINSRPSPYDIFFWDWDDPEYCRAMCIALGFTADDLTP